MKTRFSTYDLICSVTELQKLIGLRVQQVYDVDHKTYLIKLQQGEQKAVLLFESGIRIHTTASEWPKNVAPSGFSMKLRKHLRNKRLESMKQLGIDRIVDMQFGSGEAAYHVILELYDRGNIVLTDCELTILNVLRPHTEGEEVRFAVREKYPLDRARQRCGPPELDRLREILLAAKRGETIKKILNPHLDYGSAMIEHVLQGQGFPNNCKLGKTFDVERDLEKLVAALGEAELLVDTATKVVSKGYITQKKESRPQPDGTQKDFFANEEFHPTHFRQFANLPVREMETFDIAVDEFYSSMESQKIDMKAVQQEKEAVKKLQNVRRDHEQRVAALKQTQEVDVERAELITRNQPLVDRAIMAIRSALASQMPWPDIELMVKEATAQGDPVASVVKGLKLATNHITLLLSDPYDDQDSSDETKDKQGIKPTTVDIDLDLSAFSNARRYYDQKRHAAKKQQKTIESQGKALKSAEKKTKQTLKEMQTITTINKARKVYWFEKFFWFISSENYLVIGGRDQQQNELIVKRYMRPGDIYVHADITGASSVVIKNPGGGPMPPKTLNEAGVMAVSYSVAWEAKVVTSAWWVHSDQVSKTAPTGEYLTTGSFMIRGKKNYLPPCHLIMGFSFLFKLEESSVFRHMDERKVRALDEESVVEETEEQEVELLEEEGEEDVEDEADGKKETAGEELQETESDQDEEPDDENHESSEHEEEEGEGNDTKPEFPDTEIKMEHVKGNQLAFHTKATPMLPLADDPRQAEDIIFLGDNKPVLLKSQSGRQRKPSENKPHKDTVTTQSESRSNSHAPDKTQVKRGQKSKLKKIKEKYKFQDDEERQLRMEILQSAGGPKSPKKQKKKDGAQTKSEKGSKPSVRPAPVPRPHGDDSDGEEPLVTADVDMLTSLTGQPVSEDEILFAIPVIAPYNVLLNYKFKVKLTPGTGKRGKAARTAVSMFLKDRGISPREKDVIRSVKDELLARNIPGKVKLSAPQMQKLRK